MTVDVASDIGALEQFHVIGAGHCTHVVDLGNSREEELNRASCKVMLVIAAQCRVVGRIDLVEIQIRGRSPRCFARFSLGVCVDCFDEAVNIRIGNQSLEGAIQLV